MKTCISLFVKRSVMGWIGLWAILPALAQPAGWSYAITGENHTLVVPVAASLLIDGQPLPLGSYLGAFYTTASGGLACAGYTQWNGASTSIAIFGNDGSLPGYAPGEAIKLKVARPDGCVIHNVSLSYLSGGIFSQAGNYAANGISGLASLNGLGMSLALASTPSNCDAPTGTASASAADGQAPYSYLWSSSPAQQGALVSGLGAGTYQVSVSDANGCQASGSIGVPNFPAPAPPVLAPAEVCAGSPALLTGTGTQLRWYDSTGTLISSGPQWASPALQSNLSVFATQTVNGCESPQASASVTVHPLPQVSLMLPDSLCINSFSFSLSGGLPAGGFYAGPGVAGSQFTPALAGPGRHTLTYVFADQNGCQDSARAALDVLPQPPLPEILSAGGDSLYSSVEGDAYVWLRDGQVLSQNGRGLRVTASGSYRVVVFRLGCYSDTSLTYAFTPLSLGEPRFSSFRLYPNPARGQVRVQWPSGFEARAAALLLYDALGRECMQIADYQEDAAISLYRLPPGCYRVVLRQGERQASASLLLER